MAYENQPDKKVRPLDGRSIVIVGGTSGLGASAARACAVAGARLTLVGRDAAKANRVLEELRAAGCEVKLVLGDAMSSETAERAVVEAVGAFQAIDGLYHVAGGSGRRMGDGPLDQISDEGWRETLHWNLDSLFYSNRAAVRQMLKQPGGGSILNMTSVLAFSPSPEHFATHGYAAAKAAVIGFTRSIAAYYARNNIRANCLAPALIETPMSRRAAGDESIRNFIARKQPLDGGRIGSPEDLDAAVVFLLSNQSRFITGQTLAVDGGWSVSEGCLTE